MLAIDLLFILSLIGESASEWVFFIKIELSAPI
jgi:hypothetical protein